VAIAGNRTFVGIGFGAIQAGLFLFEAFKSGGFGRMVVSEVMPELVAAVRRNRGHFRVNIAHPEGVESADVGPIEIHDPAYPESQEALIEAIAEASEIATAVPSVAFYVSNRPGSIHCLLAEGLRLKGRRNGPLAVIYAAENHNHAAEILREKVFEQIPPQERPEIGRRVRFLNTVIGKMSGVVSDPEQIEQQRLEKVTPDDRRAFLVEAFNRILISKIDFEDGLPAFQRGIRVFLEKEDLLPFEEAKLFGHNATHALAAYLAMVAGKRYIAELKHSAIFSFLREAFIEESGGALVRKYQGVDPLFTPDGYRDYVDDLLERMTNPFLKDTAERVGRDPERKLGWDDRLIGTIRLALDQRIEPRRYAVGAAAALTIVDPSLWQDHPERCADVLKQFWGEHPRKAEEEAAVLQSISRAFTPLCRWKSTGCAGRPEIGR